MFDYFGGLGSLPMAKHMKSRAINAENPTGGERKGRPCRKPAGTVQEGKSLS